MRITYDSVADASYIYLTAERKHLETITVEPFGFDLMVDVDEDQRLQGIEVLDASERLDLRFLRPYIDKLDGPVFRWFHLAWELDKLLKSEFPIKGNDSHGKAWVIEIGRDTLAVRLDDTGEVREYQRHELEDLDIKPARVIRELGILHTLYEMGRPPWPAEPYTITVERDLSELAPNQ